MERYQVILAYDGSRYQGFQRQGRNSDNILTVQDAVESALCKVGWQGGSLLAAGRTDTGVHASGQVIAFDLTWKHTLDELFRALNAHLPLDIAVQSLRIVPSDFHPRFDAIARSYVYSIYAQAMRDPLRERYTWRVWPLPDVDVLQEVASLLLGKHDFAAFGTPPRAKGSTWRTVQQAAWHQVDDQLTFRVTADAFLYHMVRRFVYVQVAIAQGRMDVAMLAQAVANPIENSKKLKPGLAPPQGLVLSQVHYLADWHRPRINLEDHELQELNSCAMEK